MTGPESTNQYADDPILIVDDEESVCDLLRFALGRSGFKNLTVANRGQQALEALGLNGDDEDEFAPVSEEPRFALVLMDIVLPDFSGYDVCSRVKRRYSSRLPVILMSGFSIEENHARYIQAGADDFIVKPFNLRELLARAKMALQRRREAEELALRRTSKLSTSFRLKAGIIEPGDEVAGFVVEELISWGGASVLYTVLDAEEQNRYVLKLLSRRAADHPDVTERFMREVEQQADLAHPNIIRIITHGTHYNCPFYIMEYLDGENLEHFLRRQERMAFEDAMAVATGVASALKCIHDRDIVHRDVTLGNIMWRSSDRTAKLTDFGISVKLGQTRLTQHGCAVGTPLYMAPEVFKGGSELSPATDIYSFGACLYHLITGRPPFVAENAIELARHHLNHDADPMSSIRPGVAPEWDELIVRRCLAKAPTDRPQAVDAILAELAVLEQSPF